jgi:hypothetical protein
MVEHKVPAQPQAAEDQDDESDDGDHCLVTGKGVDQQVSCSYTENGGRQMHYLTEGDADRVVKSGRWCNLDRWDKDKQVCRPK